MAMKSQSGTFERLGRHLALALRPLSDAISNPEKFKQLMHRLGWNATAMPPTYASLGTLVDAAGIKLNTLPEHPPIADVLDLIGAVKGAFGAIQSIGVAPPGVNAAAFIPEIRSRLFEILLTDYFAAELPASFNLLSSLNVIDFQPVDATADRPSFVRVNFKWSEIPKILTQPMELPKRVYGWGSADFDVQKLFDQLGELFFALRFPVRFEMPDEGLVRRYAGLTSGRDPHVAKSLIVPFFYIASAGKDLEAAFVLRHQPAANGKLPGIIIEPQIPPEFPLSMRLSDTITMRLRARTNAAALFGIVLRPSEISIKFPMAPATPPPSGGIGIGFDFNPGTSTLVFGDPAASRLEFSSASVDLDANFTNGLWSGSLAFDLKGLRFMFDPGEGDGFLRFLIGGDTTEIGLPLALRWGQEGIHFAGSGSLEVVVHPHIAIGPASIDEVDFRLTVPNDPKPTVRLEIGAGISGGIGPVSFTLNGVGLRADAVFEPGNAGPLDLKIGFKPPTGVGVSIDGGGFRGGGGLEYDAPKGEYFGTLELTFAEVISVRAVGILSTRLPDGSDTFSLLLIIVSEFVPIQLSYGFTLLGVGGLLGLNRTVDLDALQVGVRDGTLNSILFPTDVVANAPRIISDLKRVFQPHDGRFLFGPMGKLGWGTPTLISVEIGLLLEIPRPAFAIIGVMRVQLPAEEFGTIYIQVNFSGSVDFEKGQLQFDASLYNSRILIDPITGDLALRIYWGGDPNFLLTVGGFHPAYTPPPMNIGTLERVGFVLVAGIPMVRAEVYLAITSNSVQFGAHVEVLYGVSFFNVFGFVDLDVLIQFNPFMFIAEISAMVGVRSGTNVLFGIRISGTLKGPTPWNVHGEASFEIGFIIKVRLSANFDVTAGESRNTLLPAIDVLGEIRKAVDNVGNWRTVLPNGASQHVSLRELPRGDALILHPFGALEINQKVAPLNIALQRFGSSRPESGGVFKLASVQINKALVVTVPTTEQFAPAQFFELSDAEKLSRPAFARYESGLVIGADNAPQTDFCRARDAQYEVIYLPEHAPTRIFFKLVATLFNAFGRGNAAAQSPLSKQSRTPSAVAAEHVSVAEEQYAVVSTIDMTLHAEPLVFGSATAAHQAIATLVEAQPELTGAIQVVPSAQIRRVA